jgi:hypothetical protein
LKLGYEQSKVYQDYETMAIILSQALGGGKKKPEPPKTAEEAHSQFAAVFGQKKK